MRQKILDLIENVLGLGHGTVSETAKIEDVEGWDSLAHVIIIGELEAKLGISIPLDEAIGINCVEELFEKAGV